MRTLARDNPLLLQLISRFHARPAGCVHADRWPDALPASLRNRLNDCRRARGRLHDWMTAAWGINLQERWEFARPSERIALLSPDQLGSLVTFCGAALHATAIQQAIDRDTQAAYRAALGEEVLQFALRRASLVTGILPEPLTSQRPRPDEVADSLTRRGLECLSLCVIDAPRLRERLEWSLPPDQTLAGRTGERGWAEPVWQCVRRILVTEIAFELKPCFD